MRIKMVNSSKDLGGSVNPKMKWSAEALMLISEVTEQPSFTENDIAELVGGVTDKRTIDGIWSWLKTEGKNADAPKIFFEKLGFSAANLSPEETINLKILLAKFVRPKLRELETEMTVLTNRIESLGSVIEMTKTNN